MIGTGKGQPGTTGWGGPVDLLPPTGAVLHWVAGEFHR